MKKSIIITIAAISYAIILFMGLTTSSSNIPRLGFDISIFHIPAFFILTFLVRLMFTSKLFRIRRALLYSFVISLLFALTTEFLQKGIPTRTFSATDIFFNILGIVLYMVIDYEVEKRIMHHVI